MSLDFGLTQTDIDGNKFDCFDSNITHNLGKMADKAGIYEALWHPSDMGAKSAKDIVEVLENGLKSLKEKPEYYKQFNSPNGWGMYKHFVPFVEKVLSACKTNPSAKIRVSI